MHATFLLERGVGTVIKLQLNLSSTATLGTEESGHCREVLNESQFMDFFVHRDKKMSGRCTELVVSGGWTLFILCFIDCLVYT